MPSMARGTRPAAGTRPETRETLGDGWRVGRARWISARPNSASCCICLGPPRADRQSVDPGSGQRRASGQRGGARHDTLGEKVKATAVWVLPLTPVPEIRSPSRRLARPSSEASSETTPRTRSHKGIGACDGNPADPLGSGQKHEIEDGPPMSLDIQPVLSGLPRHLQNLAL